MKDAAVQLESMAMEMPKVKGHPNRAGFRGVLTLVDVASERAPSGSGGRRVVLTRPAAEAALPSLLGMALDYAPSFDRHDVRTKVGVITSAEVVGRELQVEGYLYAKDFPEIVEEVGRSSNATLSRKECETKVGQPSISPTLAAKSAARMGHPGWGNRSNSHVSLAAAVRGLRNLTQGIRGNGIQRVAGLGMSFEVTDAVLADRRSKIWTLVKVTFTGAAILRRDKAAFQETWIELA